LWENSSSAELGLATTGSNTFIGNQIISGNLNVSGAITATSASFQYLQTIFETASVIYSSGSNQFGDASDDTQTLFGKVDIKTGPLVVTGSTFISGATFNAKVEAPALSVGVTTLDTLFESTQSGVPSQIDITRLGAGPTGDLTGVRLQTLSGSDTTGDTLLSRITTGVNRHTSTAMTGSVVNTTLTSTWATGSGGTRVAYQTSINANAQSASATLTLNAGNLASNNVGGTASIAAGLIRIGTNAAHIISSTGSFGPIVIAGPLNQPAFSLRSGSFEVTTPQGSGSFYTNLPITSSAGRINGDLFVLNNLTASVISASVISASIYVGLPVTTGSNTFKDTQTIDLSATSIITASAIIGNSTEVITDMYVNGGNFDTFNVQVVANNGVKLRDFNGVDTTPFLSVDTNGGNVRIPRNTNITGSLNVSSSQNGDEGNLIRGGVTIVGNNLGNALAVNSGSVAITSPQGTGFFYSNLPITSSGLRINGVALVNDLIISGVFSGNSSLQVAGNASVSGSFTSVGAITGSVISASQYIGFIQSASIAQTASSVTPNQTLSGTTTLTGTTSLTGSVVITGSAPTQQWVSGGLTLSGSLVSNVTDIYTGSNNANFIITLGSASMATLIASETTNPNTLYFVI
jgi:hypothetical protein